MAKYPFTRVDGVELSRELARIAEKHLKCARIAHASVYRGDAAEFTALDPYTFIYMFNPFPRVVVESVMRNLAASLQRQPRRVIVCYKNPTCADVVAAAGFRHFNTFDHSNHRFLVFLSPHHSTDEMPVYCPWRVD